MQRLLMHLAVPFMLVAVQSSMAAEEMPAGTGKWGVSCSKTENFDQRKFNDNVVYAVPYNWKLQQEGVVESMYLKMPHGEGIAYIVNAPDKAKATEIVENNPLIGKDQVMFKCDIYSVAPLWMVGEKK